ncbi:hypothetical protein GVY41_03420 [Frigidibacter albus]|uniref:YMGG-like Gly-zipper domain-containing protein n=1 Tax=Frigidibacter albus TaxID=1465486 RepID=A0A6L8VDD7_9RHOB|nr:hypothetical protein [Frigidibacter albus]MZQ88273.1 hypothetical protein [Frigidibacter albus]NBE30053.1 hypothetical protein [Frigidibacter albus]GGH46409.1 hypothetical protein GCM10011341_06880 [Frigidibacter albus]
MQSTRIRLTGAVLAIGLLASCGENDFERAAVGASIGGVGSALTGGSAVKGAVIGGAAGALCDDVNLC